ncbi:urease accessory protein UreE [Thiohalorhabdus denitrificans]|uniref:Urease accessory protein UreE n=1 Tax=Thiohalorhabdus denitrificans TaxID=381306 RepID=A0A0P9CAC5_9GAMM|nr:urease accessory protein UreE [Thiohalorhabdus denitrificans]KPV39963.1 urease accessory protein UreE [Thiohalorhabdus denitrificans]SCY09964.1 urease accessory protein [Thiohalorhabdus denitrificans]
MQRLIERYTEPTEPQTTLTLPCEVRQRSRARVRLDDGEEAGLFLPRGTFLRGGDRLRAESGLVVEVVAAQEPVTTAYAPDEPALARACYHLGNRHVPLQVGEFWVRYGQDHVLDGMVAGLGLEPVAEFTVFEPEEGAFAGHNHGHHARREISG